MVRRLRWLLWPAVYAWCFLVSLGQGFSPTDESWYLQVIHRICSGDVLYRDLFFGVTPLSVYLTTPFVKLFGSEIIVVKGVVSICFALIIFFTCRIVHRLHPGGGFPLLLVLLLFSQAQPWNRPLYNPLSVLWLLVCFHAALAWKDHVSSGANSEKSSFALPVMAGTAAGLCFATKQSLGILAMAALLAAQVIIRREACQRERRNTAPFWVAPFAFIVTIAIVMVPVLLSGGTEKFIEYGFTAKGTFLEVARISYWSGVAEWFQSMLPPFSNQSLERFYWRGPFLLPLICFPALLTIWRIGDRGKRNTTTIVLAFVTAAFLGVFPRADLHHMKYVVPVLLIGLIHAWQQIKPSIATNVEAALRFGVYAWSMIGVAFVSTIPLAGYFSGNLKMCELPHFQNTLIRPFQEKRMINNARALSGVAKEAPIFLLSGQASLYYLIADLASITPFDFPLATAYGHDGQSRVIELLESGEIQFVGLDPNILYMPEDLERFVKENMKQETSAGFFRIYRVPAPPAD